MFLPLHQSVGSLYSEFILISSVLRQIVPSLDLKVSLHAVISKTFALSPAVIWSLRSHAIYTCDQKTLACLTRHSDNGGFHGQQTAGGPQPAVFGWQNDQIGDFSRFLWGRWIHHSHTERSAAGRIVIARSDPVIRHRRGGRARAGSDREQRCRAAFTPMTRNDATANQYRAMAMMKKKTKTGLAGKNAATSWRLSQTGCRDSPWSAGIWQGRAIACDHLSACVSINCLWLGDIWVSGTINVVPSASADLGRDSGQSK